MRKLLIVVAATTIIVVSILYIQSLPSGSLVVTKGEMEQARETSNGIINRHIEIKKGDNFKLTLYAHWSAGMKWSANFDGFSIVGPDGARQFTNDGPPGTVGSPGHEDWFFKAIDRGKTTITMTFSSVADLPDAEQNVNTLILEVEVK